MKYLEKGGRRLSPAELRNELAHLKQRPNESLEEFADRTNSMVAGGYPDTPVMFQNMLSADTFIAGCVYDLTTLKDTGGMHFDDIGEALEYVKEHTIIQTDLFKGTEVVKEKNDKQQSEIKENETKDTDLIGNLESADEKEGDNFDDKSSDDGMSSDRRQMKTNLNNQSNFMTTRKLHLYMHEIASENETLYTRRKMSPCNTQLIYTDAPNQIKSREKRNKYQVEHNRLQDQEVKRLAHIVDELAPDFIYKQTKVSSTTLRNRQFLYWLKTEEYEVLKDTHREPTRNSTTCQPDVKDQGTQTLNLERENNCYERSKHEEKGTQTKHHITEETTRKGEKKNVNIEYNTYIQPKKEKTTGRQVKDKQRQTRVMRKQKEESGNKYREKVMEELKKQRKDNDVTTPNTKRKITRIELYKVRVGNKMRKRKPAIKTMRRSY